MVYSVKQVAVFYKNRQIQYDACREASFDPRTKRPYGYFFGIGILGCSDLGFSHQGRHGKGISGRPARQEFTNLKRAPRGRSLKTITHNTGRTFDRSPSRSRLSINLVRSKFDE